MPILPLRFSTLFLLTASLLLAACQVPLPYLPALPAGENAAIQSNGESDIKSDTVTPDSDAPNERSDAMPEDEVDPSSATIVVSSLRMRSGPGVEYEVIGAAQAGDTFPVVGQANGCQWLNVEHPTLGNVWLSGGAQYTKIAGACDQIPAVEPPPLDNTSVPAPDVTPAPVEEPGQQSAPAPTTAPTVEAVAPPPAEAESAALPTDQGCYLFQNFVGPELNVTVTAMDWDWNDNFRVPEGGERPYCFGQGRYAITIDAPPPWDDLNTEINVHAGEHFLFPVEGRN